MSVDLAPDVWNEIQRHIATGRYASPEDVLRDALNALRYQKDELEAIQQGIDDTVAERILPIREFDRQFRQRNAVSSGE